jgi:hypothetical protein
LERSRPHLHVDEIVGQEEIPFLGERAARFGPELQRVVTARDAALTVFVGLES